MCEHCVYVCVCPSVHSNSSMENITSNFSMECGTYEQLGYWPNNFDDFAVSNLYYITVTVVNDRTPFNVIHYCDVI